MFFDDFIFYILIFMVVVCVFDISNEVVVCVFWIEAEGGVGK